MMGTWEAWLDAIAAGEPVTVESFVRSAMSEELPRVTTTVRKLDPNAWPAGALDEESEG